MKKLLYLTITLVLTMAIVSCNSKATSKQNPDVVVTSETAKTATDTANDSILKDYINYKDNTIVEFTSQDNPVYNQNYYTSFSDKSGDKFQRKTSLPYYGGEYEEIFQFANGEFRCLFHDAQSRFHENLINETNFPSDTQYLVLKEPLEVGNTWNVAKDVTAKIVSMKCPVEVPYGKYEDTMEVDSTYKNGNAQKDYYEKGVGLVKTVFITPEKGEIQSELTSIKENVPITLQMKSFVYDASLDVSNADVSKYYYTQNVKYDFNTNADYLKILENELKVDTGLGPIIGSDSKVNSVKIDRTNDALTIDMSKSYETWLAQNSGASVEKFMIRRLVDTVGNFYHATNITITCDGGVFKSAHNGDLTGANQANLVKQ